jgi:hypothetical protein
MRRDVPGVHAARLAHLDHEVASELSELPGAVRAVGHGHKGFGSVSVSSETHQPKLLTSRMLSATPTGIVAASKGAKRPQRRREMTVGSAGSPEGEPGDPNGN